MDKQASELTLGPVLFNWSPERWRDFYFRIADEAPVSIVYVGEVICSKRAPLFEPYMDAVAERLSAAGKTVVFSALAEVMSTIDRKAVNDVCARQTAMVEANDASALLPLRGRPHHIGPFMNVYNERTVGVLARGGARNICLPPEMPAEAIAALCAATADSNHDRGAGIRPAGPGPIGALLSRARPRPHQGQLPLHLRERSRRHAAAHNRRQAVPGGKRHPDHVA